MKLGIAVLVTAVLLAWPCQAQEDYRIELFGGYVNQKGDGTETRNGWIASETVYLRPWIGITAEFAGLYNEHDFSYPTESGDFRANLEDSQHSFLFGPRFRLFSKKRFTLGAHGLFGVTRSEEGNFAVLNTSQESGDTQTPFVFNRTSTDFAGAVGLDFDVKLSDRFSWRAQPDWYFANRFGTRQDSFRVSTGIVFRFGR